MTRNSFSTWGNDYPYYRYLIGTTYESEPTLLSKPTLNEVKTKKETTKTEKQPKNNFYMDCNGKKFSIKRVKFSNPATIVFWSDGTKTVVKTTEKDIFDKEKGLALAIVKKISGNEPSYFKIFRKLCDNDDT